MMTLADRIEACPEVDTLSADDALAIAEAVVRACKEHEELSHSKHCEHLDKTMCYLMSKAGLE